MDVELELRLSAVLLQTPWFHRALVAVQCLGIISAYIGAGAIRNAVWDSLYGYAVPSPLADIDVVFFDDRNTSSSHERSIESRLCYDCPDLPWEVTNQATVHLWFETYFGYPVPPLESVEDAVRTWPETATCMAVRLDSRNKIEVLAPYGLRDLFEMKIRWNLARITIEGFLERVRQKNYRQRWPKVDIILPGSSTASEAPGHLTEAEDRRGETSEP